MFSFRRLRQHNLTWSDLEKNKPAKLKPITAVLVVMVTRGQVTPSPQKNLNPNRKAFRDVEK